MRAAPATSSCSAAASCPKDDMPKLEQIGVAKIFTPGASTNEIIDWVEIVPASEGRMKRRGPCARGSARCGVQPARARAGHRRRAPRRSRATDAAADAAVSDDETARRDPEGDERARRGRAAAAGPPRRPSGSTSRASVDAQIDIGSGARATRRSSSDTHRATQRSPTCLVDCCSALPWAPPLLRPDDPAAVQVQRARRAERDRSPARRVARAGRRSRSRVLLDENNTGNGALSMFEVAIAAGGTTGLRTADRAELWYFLEPGRRTVDGKPVAAGDMVYVPAHGAREVAAADGDGRRGARRRARRPRGRGARRCAADAAARRRRQAGARELLPASAGEDATARRRSSSSRRSEGRRSPRRCSTLPSRREGPRARARATRPRCSTCSRAPAR